MKQKILDTLSECSVGVLEGDQVRPVIPNTHYETVANLILGDIYDGIAVLNNRYKSDDDLRAMAVLGELFDYYAQE